MDANQVLLMMVVLSCVATLVRGVRRSVRQHLDWLVLAVGVLVVTGVAVLVAPPVAGYVAGGVWGVTMVLPGLLARSTGLLVIRRRFRLARLAAILAACLHPSRRWRGKTGLLRALVLAQAGRLDEAQALLDHYANQADSRYRALAVTNLMRLRNDWAGLRAWLEARGEGVDPELLPLYVRALGEVGDLTHLLIAYSATEVRAHRQLGAVQWYSCVMFLLAFCGRVESLKLLLANKLGAYPEAVREFWLATAEMAATGDDRRMHALAERTDELDPLLAAGIRQRLATPPIRAPETLPVIADIVLAKVDAELDQLERYGDRLMVHARRAYVTWFMIAANVAVFVASVVMGGSTNEQVLDRLGTLLVARLAVTGEYWRIVAANFIHYGWLHLAMNMLGLLLLGPFVEHAIGRARYLLVYLGCGVGAMTTVYFLTRLHWLNVDGVLGASGCVMGLVGATGAILWRAWRRERSGLLRRRLVFIVLILFLQTGLDAVTPQVSGTAHLAGAFYGVLLGLALHLRI